MNQKNQFYLKRLLSSDAFQIFLLRIVKNSKPTTAQIIDTPAPKNTDPNHNPTPKKLRAPREPMKPIARSLLFIVS